MISQEIIKKITDKYQTTELNVRREYFQHLFLSYFYAQPETDKIYFKGGTALRLIYNSPRFSEDLDFSSSLKDIKKIEHAVVTALSEIEREGSEVGIDEAKETTGGYLAAVNFKNNSHTTIIQLEISFREGKKKGEVATIASDFIPPYTLVQLSQSMLIAEKIKALLDRKKPRDFYDLYFILRAGLLSAEEKSILSEALEALKKVDIQFDQELKIFLPKSHWPVIRNFSTMLEREIKKFL